MLNAEFEMYMPPPYSAELLVKMTSLRSGLLPERLIIPPPYSPAALEMKSTPVIWGLLL